GGHLFGEDGLAVDRGNDTQRGWWLLAAGGGEAKVVLVVVLWCRGFLRRWRRLLYPFDDGRKRPPCLRPSGGAALRSMGSFQHPEDLLTSLFSAEAARPFRVGSQVVAQP